MALTEQEYIKQLGLICPNCKLMGGVEPWDRPEVDDGTVYQIIGCGRCEANWVNNYNLVGYSDLELAEDEE